MGGPKIEDQPHGEVVWTGRGLGLSLLGIFCAFFLVLGVGCAATGLSQALRGQLPRGEATAVFLFSALTLPSAFAAVWVVLNRRKAYVMDTPEGLVRKVWRGRAHLIPWRMIVRMVITEDTGDSLATSYIMHSDEAGNIRKTNISSSGRHDLLLAHTEEMIRRGASLARRRDDEKWWGGKVQIYEADR